MPARRRMVVALDHELASPERTMTLFLVAPGLVVLGVDSPGGIVTTFIEPQPERAAGEPPVPCRLEVVAVDHGGGRLRSREAPSLRAAGALRSYRGHRCPIPHARLKGRGALAATRLWLTLTGRMITTNQFKNGNHIEVDGTIFKIVDFQHVKPGKGGAFVRTKLRRASDGNVIDKTFRAGEKFRSVRTEARKMQFLYADGTDAHFMDTESYEQLAVPEASVAEALRWTKPNDEVEVLFIDEPPGDLQLPSAVDLEVTETDPGLRGDTASGGGNKPATLETGATIQVPLFVEHRRPRPRRHALGRVHVARLAYGRDQRRAAVFALYQHDVTGRPRRRTCWAATRRPSRARWSTPSTTAARSSTS